MGKESSCWLMDGLLLKNGRTRHVCSYPERMNPNLFKFTLCIWAVVRFPAPSPPRRTRVLVRRRTILTIVIISSFYPSSFRSLKLDSFISNRTVADVQYRNRTLSRMLSLLSCARCASSHSTNPAGRSHVVSCVFRW